MSPDAPDYLALIETLIEDWKRQDLDPILDRLTDDVEYHYLVGKPPLMGKEIVRKFLTKFGAKQSDIAWRIINHAVNDNKLLVEGMDEYVDDKGQKIQTPYMGIFEFQGDRIHRWRDYLNPEGLDG